MGIDNTLPTEPYQIYIGYDSREPVCSYVCAHSIKKRTQSRIDIHYLQHRNLREQGKFNRPWVIGLGGGNEMVDMLDGKTFSTEFSHTRFLVPHLMGYKGWALFMDADMISLSNIKRLFALCDDKYAVMCVKHIYPPKIDAIKMDNRAQRLYARKNWSSFVLWNCGHPSNRDLTVEKVNYMTGADLHGFSWLKDSEIGTLPFSYNFIPGISPKLPPGCNVGKSNIPQPDVIHFSDGGPWFESCRDVPYAEFWTQDFESWQRDGDGNKYNEIPTTRYER